MPLPSYVTFSDTLFVQEVDGELVLLDTETDYYFGLDAVGKAFWDTIEANGGDIEQSIVALLEMFDVDEAILRRDMAAFLRQLEEHRLVRTESA